MADVLTRRAIEIWERLEAEVERLKGVLREYEGEAETLRRIEGEQAAEIAALREAAIYYVGKNLHAVPRWACSFCEARTTEKASPNHEDWCALAVPPSAHVARFQAIPEKLELAYHLLTSIDVPPMVDSEPWEAACDGWIEWYEAAFGRALREGDGASG